MIAYMLETIEDAEKLVNICKKYKDEHNIDTHVIWSNYTIDSCSLLGVVSLLGHVVSIQCINPEHVNGYDYYLFVQEIQKNSKCY